jgi:hypothetical protein
MFQLRGPMKLLVFLAAAACAVAAEPAVADTRGDVMSAMQRCRAVLDDRAWLDCTYGAEQPMRAKLGLPPAPEYQQRLVPPVSQSQPRMAPPPVDNRMTAAARPVPLPRRGASLMQVLTGTAQPVAVSGIAAVRYDSQGAFVLTLENGQTWRQTDIENGVKARPKIGVKATVTPAAMGSYNLQMENFTHVFKVSPRT